LPLLRRGQPIFAMQDRLAPEVLHCLRSRWSAGRISPAAFRVFH
jgi:hypothetical protein